MSICPQKAPLQCLIRNYKYPCIAKDLIIMIFWIFLVDLNLEIRLYLKYSDLRKIVACISNGKSLLALFYFDHRWCLPMNSNQSKPTHVLIEIEMSIWPILKKKNKIMKLTRTLNYPNGYLLIAPIVSSKPSSEDH